MAFENFWRRDRDRTGGDRNRDDWRSRAGEWREAIQGGRGQRDYGRQYTRGEDQDFNRRGWREGSDYYGNRDEGYRARGGEGYGGYARGEESSDNWREDRMSYGEYGGSGFGRDYGGRGYEADYERRGSGRYGGTGGAESGSSLYGRMGTQEQHRGRGPRGYRRSDERIREDICDMLTEDPYIDASNMEVTVKDCEVTLSGTVNSREDKRRAEDLAERITGVKDVHNTLRVSNEPRSTESATAQAAQRH